MFKAPSSRLVLASTVANGAGLCALALDAPAAVGPYLIALSLLVGIAAWFFAAVGK
jgi:hypothetical protein